MFKKRRVKDRKDRKLERDDDNIDASLIEHKRKVTKTISVLAFDSKSDPTPSTLKDLVPHVETVAIENQSIQVENDFYIDTQAFVKPVNATSTLTLNDDLDENDDVNDEVEDEWEEELLRRSGVYKSADMARIHKTRFDKNLHSEQNSEFKLQEELSQTKTHYERVQRNLSLHNTEISIIKSNLMDIEKRNTLERQTLNTVKRFLTEVEGMRSCLRTKQPMMLQVSQAMIALNEECLRGSYLMRQVADVCGVSSQVELGDGGEFPRQLLGGEEERDEFGRNLGYLKQQQLQSRISSLNLSWKSLESSWENTVDVLVAVDSLKQSKRESIHEGWGLVFEDVALPFSSFPAFLEGVKEFRNDLPEIHLQCFVELALSHLVKPYILYELVQWCHWEPQLNDGEHPWQRYPRGFQSLESCFNFSNTLFMEVYGNIIIPYLTKTMIRCWDLKHSVQFQNMMYLYSYSKKYSSVNLDVLEVNITSMIEKEIKMIALPVFREQNASREALCIQQACLGLRVLSVSKTWSTFVPSIVSSRDDLVKRWNRMVSSFDSSLIHKTNLKF